MKNNILIHKNSNSNKIILKYIIALLPLLAYGFYKNGILLYLNDVIKIDKVFLILLYPLIGVLCAIVVNLIKYRA